MNSSSHVEDAPPVVDKGKRRAPDPTERTPLLGSQSSIPLDDEPPNPTIARRRLLSRLVTIFLGTFAVTLLVFVALALLAWSYASRASHATADDILNQGMVFQGPNRVDVLNITWTGGIWVNVEARVGFDAGSVIGVNASPDGDAFFQDIWKAIGRWGVRSLDRVSVNMSTIYLTSQSNPSVILATIEPTPVEVPLTANPPLDLTWLTHISTPLLIRPTTNTSALIQFVREAWRDGSAAVRAEVGNVEVHGGALSESSWRNLLHSQLSDVRTALRIQIPPIPGIPQTGPVPSLSELITLQSFNLYSESNSLALTACATFPDPAPTTFNLTSPSLPFTISLPSVDNEAVPVASVSTAPFTLTHPNITLDISGAVLPILAISSSLLSSFVTRYLSGLANPILVSTTLIPGLAVDLEFPAPNPRPQILRNVTIHDMVIRPAASSFTASGTVYARVVLPPGMQVGLHVGRVLPDVLVFDGEVPTSAIYAPRWSWDPPPPGSPQLPDPLPEHAFGHIRPDDWLTSYSGPVPSEDGEGAAFAVTAKIVDVPLEVLPGRQKEFSNFVSKVIFGSDGAVAGILGVAGVAVDVFGLPFPGDDGESEIELNGLPFRGSVLVGKKSLLGIGGAVRHSTEELKRLMERFLGHGKRRLDWTVDK
ncbi:hypothetical protein C8R43DRAFT_1077421 [Mycena crocata]|nr:hypothetical protein C8R43DRAFT_1077421 [Mycena crocata]